MRVRLRHHLFRVAAVLGAVAVLSVATPAPAQADDIWCRIFGAGCGDGSSSSQSSPQRDVPEIDPSALASAIALAAGGAAVLRGRTRRRR